MSHPMQLSRPVPTFCDVCNKIAFGLLLKCSNCHLVCHKSCQSQIGFHCQSDKQRTIESGKQENTEIRRQSPEEEFNTIRKSFTRSQIKSKLEDYNRTVKNKLIMTLRSDSSFTGYIRVELELTRPVTTKNKEGNVDIMYLPKNTVKAIHLTSANTAEQVIKALLQKFQIQNDPRKYVLCERKQRGKEGDFHVTLRPLQEGERPLFLTLLWGSAHSGHGFRLKDQMDNDPIWDDFKEAELEAFLRMYEDEETRAINEIQSNYDVLAYQIETILSSQKRKATHV